MSDFMLMLIVVPQLEEEIVDWLLERSEVTGFSSNPIYGQSQEHKILSIVEQVIGRQRKVMFHVHLKAEKLPSVLSSLRLDFEGTGLDYWVIPIVESGRL